MPEDLSREARLRRLMERHADLVSRTLRCYGVRPAELDDGLQMVFMIAARHLDSIEADKERGFLATSAYRVAWRVRRGRARRRESNEEPSLELEAPGASPEAAARQRESFALIHKILETMPEDLVEIFVLFEIEQCSSIEIAEALSIPRGTVASRLRRARDLFQHGLKRLDGASGGDP